MVDTRVCYKCNKLRPTPEMEAEYDEEGEFQYWECHKCIEEE